MASHLSEIEIIDLRTSVLDDGDVTPARVVYGEAVNDRKNMDRFPDVTDADKKKQDALIKKAKAELVEQEKLEQKRIDAAKASGMFKFRIKRFVDYSGTQGPYPAYAFKWIRYSPTNGYREYQEHVANHWSKMFTDEPYWPDGIAPSSEGDFRFGDTILMKQDLKRYLVKVEEDQLLANRAGKGEMAKFRAKVEREGGVVPDDDVEKLAKLMNP